MKNIKCFVILVLFLFSTIAGSNKWHSLSDIRLEISDIPAPPLSNDEPDQSQTNSNSNYHIYGNFWAAQSFKTKMGKITRVKILINRTEKKSVNFKRDGIISMIFNLLLNNPLSVEG